MDSHFKYDIRDFQMHILGLLDVMDEVCRKHGLTYYIVGGTLLGSVRSQGFIPWDDDLDVAMFREDYEILLAHYREWLPERYSIQSFESNKDYSRHFAKLEDRNTTLVERFHLRRLEGIYLDIFPLDDVPDNRVLRWLQYRRYRLFDKLLYFCYRDPYKHGDGFSSRMIAFFQKRMSKERLHGRMKAILTRYNGKKKCSCCMTHGGGYTAIPKTAYSKPAVYKFENGSYWGPADSVTYLTLSYGKDYLTPPPPDKRETHYFQYCDFDRGYETASFDELKKLYDEQKKK